VTPEQPHAGIRCFESRFAGEYIMLNRAPAALLLAPALLGALLVMARDVFETTNLVAWCVALILVATLWSVVVRIWCQGTTATRLLTGVIALGLLARLTAYFAFAHGQPIPTGDPLIYADMAQRLANTGVLSFYDPNLQINFVAFYPPLYIVVLGAFCFVMGHIGIATLMLNLLIDVAMMTSLYFIGRRFLSDRAAGLSVGIYALWPNIILLSIYPQKETLLALLLVLFVGLICIAVPKRVLSAKTVLSAGFLAAALALAQPGLVLVPVAMALFILPKIELKQALALAIAAGLVTAALMTPWWLRNYQEFDRFVLLTSAGRATFDGANSDQSTGYFSKPPAHLIGTSEQAYMDDRPVPGAQVGWVWILANPATFAERGAQRIVRAAGLDYESAHRLTKRGNVGPQAYSWLQGLSQTYYLALIGLSAVLLWRLRREAATTQMLSTLQPALLAAAMQLYLVSVFFEYAQRHRYFIFGLVCWLAAGAFGAWLDQRQKKAVT
jgi:4-amino-4-deoxy-L-arabinose transferase-like glycosyltransferase